jgi:thiol:disulfide interchange protein DsbC
MKLLLTLLTLTALLFAGDIDPKQFKNIPALSAEHIKVIKAYDHGTIYELQIEITAPRGVQHTSAFLTKDKKVILFGDAMDAKTGDSIKRPLDMKAIRASADLTYGTGKNEYIVFTDPECPYCVKFEKLWPGLSKDVKLYVFFMPLSNHRNATQMSFYVMKQKNEAAKAKAILDMANGDKSFTRLTMTKEIQSLFSKKIEENQALANQFGVRGTPAVYDTKGESVNWTVWMKK